ncbi:hypothetical protein KJQ97_09575, partial [Campylobacter sp. 2018MI01]
GDYKFTFNVIGTDIKGEASLKLVADTQTNTPSVDNTTSDVVVGSENGIINIKPSEDANKVPSVDNTTNGNTSDSENGIINIKPSEETDNTQNKSALEFKVFQGDEDGYFNNLTEIPNGGRTFDTTPTFIGKSVANDT